MEIIGRYRIIEKLPGTGIATGYKAFDQEFDGDVFIKQYPKGYVTDPASRARFEREMQLLSLLNDPNVVPIYEIDEIDGRFYIVTPYMSGGTLADKISQGLVSFDEMLSIIEKLALCLESVHELGIYHQAIKPTNIIFDAEGEPYLTDFGTAKLIERGAAGTSTVSDVLFAPVYMSPEQVQGKEIRDNKSDIYSLGAVLFEMLSGQPPYVSSTYLGLAVKHVNEPIPSILDKQPGYPPGCELLAHYSLAKNPGDRFATPGQMSDTLAAVFSGETIAAIQESVETEIWENSFTVDDSAEDDLYVANQKTSSQMRVLGFAVIAFFIVVLATFFAVNKFRPDLIAQYYSPGYNSTSIAELPATEKVFSVVNSPTTTLYQTATVIHSAMNINDQHPEPTLASQTSTVTPTPLGVVPTDQVVPIIGGADKIAFINANDVWIANLDGSELERLTDDEKEKTDLWWSIDGRELIYHMLGREYRIDVFSDPVFGFAKGRCSFEEGRLISYSLDGKRVATVVETAWNDRLMEVIKVYELANCRNPDVVDVFPGGRFEMRGYSGQNDSPVIMEYAWDGADLFVLHGDVLRDGGDLTVYNMGTANARIINPVDGNCCYKDLGWSPDGQYLIFAYQDTRYDKPAQLYYIPFGTIGTGQTYEPIDLPYYFFADSGARIYPVLHPATSSFPTPTPALSPTPTPTPTPTVDVNDVYGNTVIDPQSESPVIGRTDKIAFLRNNDIWVMNVDGSGLQLIHKVGKPTTELQWSSDGQSIIYESGDCYQAVSLEGKQTISLGCYVALNTSQDAELAAVSANLVFEDNLERVRASIMPFHIVPFGRLHNFLKLETLGSCPLVEGELYHWSNDNQQIAVVVETIENNRKAQAIRVFDLGDCSEEADMVDTFPAPRFNMRGYSEEDSDPVIVDFSWDGESLFAINGNVNSNFGDFIVYDLDNKKADVLDPLKKSCCYRDMRWSADGDYIFFSTQDVQEDILLYYASYDQIKAQDDLVPVPLPKGFWDGADLQNRLYPALRSAKPDNEPPVIPTQTINQSAGDIQLEQIGTLAHGGSVYDLGISPDGRELVVGAGKLLKIWELASQETVHEFNLALNKHTESVTGAEFSPDGEMLASSSVDDTVRIWKLALYTPKFNMNEHALPVLTMTYSPDGTALASAAADGDIILWRTSNGGIYRKLIGHTMPVYSVAYTPDGQKLVSGSADKIVQVWDVYTGEVLHILNGHTAPVSSVSVSPDGKYVASSSWDATVRIWDIETGSLLHTLKSSESPVSSVVFSPSDGILVAGSEDGLISVWETSSFELIRIIGDQDSAVLSLAFSPNGTLLATGNDDGKVLLWEIGP